MRPQLALLLCVVFILVLLKRDAQAKPDVSTALWIPSIWMMIVGSRMISLWLNYNRHTEAQAVYLEGSSLDRNIFFVLMVVGFLILMRRRINISKIVQNNIWLFLFLLYCGISIIWSDFPVVSFKRYLKNIGNLIMILIVLTDPAPVEAIKRMVRRCAYVLIPLSIMLYKYYPLLGRGYHSGTGALMVTGVTNNKNSLGVLCLVCGLFLIWSLLREWRNKTGKLNKFFDIIILSMIVWLIVMADSATSLACFILGIGVLTLIERPIIKRNVKSIGFYTLLFICAFMIIQSLFDITGMVIASLGRDTTLTGRTELWDDILAMHTNPFIGVGYGSFWLGDKRDVLWGKYWWRPTEAHNGYIEIYLEVGLIGLFILGCVIVSVFKNISKSLITQFEYGRLRIALLAVIVFYNITESAFRVDLLMYFIFLLVSINVKRLRSEGYPIKDSYLALEKKDVKAMIPLERLT